MSSEHLKLENQVCFPLYAASRLMTRVYQPFLEKLGITYPQYLVLMVLWEHKDQSVSTISNKLFLNTNTLTPLLKRMEKQGIIERQRNQEDERVVKVKLTPKGSAMQKEAEAIPISLSEMLTDENLSIEDLMQLKDNLHILIKKLNEFS